ncbi:hypothetical protein IWQ60_001896 [Tieghemiomyces parasiticus]|uniref:Endonuclease/exonuclease/phosphatase domain-containing protein n=1 Tax=Tieghemiomyces parasiticus TaxID=78921 RepID=A0A9W8E1H0_9FUNG|nr:hypothetical protein IWQ60_001896 [Tieghemiomyces parasiticus]
MAAQQSTASFMSTPGASPDAFASCHAQIRHRALSVRKPAAQAADSTTSSTLSPDLSDAETTSDNQRPSAKHLFPPGLPKPVMMNRRPSGGQDGQLKDHAFQFRSTRSSVESLPAAIWDPSTLYLDETQPGNSNMGRGPSPPAGQLRKSQASPGLPLESSMWAPGPEPNVARRGVPAMRSLRREPSPHHEARTVTSFNPTSLFRAHTQPAGFQADHAVHGTVFRPRFIERSVSHSVLDDYTSIPSYSLDPYDSAVDDLLAPFQLNCQMAESATQSSASSLALRLGRKASTGQLPQLAGFTVTNAMTPQYNNAQGTYEYGNVMAAKPPIPHHLGETQRCCAASHHSCHSQESHYGYGPRHSGSRPHRQPDLPLHPTIQNRNQALVSKQMQRRSSGPLTNTQPIQQSQYPTNLIEELGLTRRMVIRDAELHNTLQDLYVSQNVAPGYSAFNPRTFSTLSWNLGLGGARSTGRSPVDFPALREVIFDQLSQIDADFLSLQELTLEDFTAHFEPRLAQRGFAGVFQHPVAGQPGCAVFFRTARFDLAESYAIRFNDARVNSRRPAPGHPHLAGPPSNAPSADVIHRFAPFANIAIIAVFSNRQTGARLRIVNTQLADGELYPDVRLLQSAVLVDHLTTRHEAKLSTVFAGDLRAPPKSDVVRYLLAGRVSRHVFRGFDYGRYSAYPLKHPLRLRNAYHQAAMPATCIQTYPRGSTINGGAHSPVFQATTSDYLLYTTPTLRMLAFYDAFQSFAASAHPGTAARPLHLPLMALFEEKPNVSPIL